MKLGAKGYLQLVKQAAIDWMNDHAPRLGAALAFYTIFSLAPLLTIVITITGLWFSENASDQVFSQLGSTIGGDNAASLESMVTNQGKSEKQSGLFTAISAGVMLFVGATGVFVQLQDSLNEIWEVEQKPGQGIMGFVRHRLLSFAMVLGIAFLLLTSLLLTTAISAVGAYFKPMFGDMTVVWHVLNFVVSFVLITLLFALMFKYVPDAKVAWSSVWFGAVVTAVLFTIGKFALGMYLGKSSVVSTYSAAGGLLLVLLWVYYTAQIVFFGAEITQAYAYATGSAVEPSSHAQWDEEKICQHEKEAGKDKTPGRKAGRRDEIFVGQPAYAGAAPSRVSGTNSSRPTRERKGVGWLLLLALALAPLERKMRR